MTEKYLSEAWKLCWRIPHVSYMIVLDANNAEFSIMVQKDPAGKSSCIQENILL